MLEKKVIIIDDDPMILDLYTRKFQERGYDVLAMNDQTFTLEKLCSFEASVVLLDINMPTKSGLDILKEIKTVCPENTAPAIILLTNSDDAASIQKGKEFGAREHIVKATKTPSEIVSIVESISL